MKARGNSVAERRNSTCGKMKMGEGVTHWETERSLLLKIGQSKGIVWEVRQET